MNKENSTIKVALLRNEIINIKLSGIYFFGDTQRRITGEWKVSIQENKLFFENELEIIIANRYAILIPLDYDASKFMIRGKSVEPYIYKGDIEFHRNLCEITIFNTVDIDLFIQSILCQYFLNNTSLEFLKAQAIILRSNLLLIKQKINKLLKTSSESEITTFYSQLNSLSRPSEFLEYRTSELLGLYKGLFKKCNPIAHEAVQETKDVVLLFDNQLCEAPQSVCCGGVTEGESIADYTDVKPYISKVYDTIESVKVDLKKESDMVDWVLDPVGCNCGQDDLDLVNEIALNKVANETNAFRWKEKVHDYYLTVLLFENMNIDLGLIQDILPIERGSSGTIKQLKLIGENKELTLQGQFLIQLRETMGLQSLSFICDKRKNVNGGYTFHINGVGMGYAYGLCQLGAMYLASKGMQSENILKHYFPGVLVENSNSASYN